MSVNRVLITGRLATIPTLVAVEGKTARCRMRLAVQRKRMNGVDRGAVFVDVTAFERTAHNCAKFLQKGSRVCIDGRLEHSEWLTQDGQRRSKHEIVAQEVEFLDAPLTPSEAPQATAEDQEPVQEPEPDTPDSDEEEGEDGYGYQDDLPQSDAQSPRTAPPRRQSTTTPPTRRRTARAAS